MTDTPHHWHSVPIGHGDYKCEDDSTPPHRSYKTFHNKQCADMYAAQHNALADAKHHPRIA